MKGITVFPGAVCRVCTSAETGLQYTVKGFDHYRCKVCNSLFVFPPPSPEYLARYYEVQSKYLTRILARGTDPSANRRLNFIERLRPEGHRLLDIGCGPGFFLTVARDRGWSVIGVEQSAQFAEYASKTLGLEIIKAPLKDAGLPEEAFDVITIAGVIEHVPEPRQFLSLAVKHLKVGGILYLLTNSSEGWMIHLTRERYPFLNPPEHLSLFSIVALRRLLGEAYLELVHINTYDAVTPDKAWRGIGRMLGKSWNEYPNQWASLISKAISKTVQPLLWSLGKLGMGSEIEVYSRKQAG